MMFVAGMQAGAISALLAQLKECGRTRDLGRGRLLHAAAVECGQESVLFVANALISMYGKCGRMMDARQLFWGMSSCDVVSWTTMIMGYADAGEGKQALEMFAYMPCPPNSFTYVAALKACICLQSQNSGAKDMGMAVHGRAVSQGCDSQLFVQNTLIDMYSKCNDLDCARRVFDYVSSPDVVSWTALITGYAEHGKEQGAWEVYACMILEGFTPNAVTLVAVLRSCAGPTFLNVAMRMHFEAACLDICTANVASVLVYVYAKSGNVVHGRRLFDSVYPNDTVSWNALLFGHVEKAQEQLALDLFSHPDYEPNAFSFVAALKSCTVLVALEKGMALHANVCHRGFHNEPLVLSGLVDLYAKCGCMVQAQRIFDLVAQKDTVIWNALITGYSRHGNMDSVFRVFQRMQDDGLQADSVTFLSLLSACSRAKLVERGKTIFASMEPKYGIQPRLDHYGCMVDMLARANQLQEAVSIVRSMPYQPDAIMWRTILGACCKWENIQAGKIAFESLLNLEATESSDYILMANLLSL